MEGKMHKKCIGCKSRTNTEWGFCLNENTYEDTKEYASKHAINPMYKNDIPSCLLVQSTYDGKCPLYMK
jgi:hypothetical protein